MEIGIDVRSAFRKKKGGIGVCLNNLVNELLKIDRENYYILYIDDNCDLPLPNNSNVRIRKLEFPFNSLWTQIRVQVDLFKYQPDIFYFTGHSIPLFCKTKSIVNIYDLTFLRTRGRKILHQLTTVILTKLAVNRSFHIITISNSTKKDLIHHYHLPDDKISVIPLAYDKKLFHQNYDRNLINEIKRKYKIYNNYILWVGTISPHKNVVRLIKAYNKLKKEGKIQHNLVIAGSKGWLYEDVFKTVDFLNLKNDVIFLDYVKLEDLPLLYSGASIFVFPSLYEGFGLPILETMACGCPVVASNVASIPEVVGDAALLFNPYNMNDIAEKILTVLENKQLKSELINKGIKRLSEFSWEKTALQTLEVFKKVHEK